MRETMDIATGATVGNEASLPPVHVLAFSRLRENHCGTQDAQKAQTSHLSNPGSYFPSRPESAKTASSPATRLQFLLKGHWGDPHWAHRPSTF